MVDVVSILKENSQVILDSINDNLSIIEPEGLSEASIYLTKAGGKMLRPSLTLITSEAVGGNKGSTVQTAAAIELIHTFSLIHDDIMDKDDMRRGKPSVHKVWGEPIAILAGDTLFSKAFEMIITSKGDDLTSEQINKTLAAVADSCVKICEGQASDMSFEGDFSVKEDAYMDMIFKKTGALIAGATKSGAIMGGADEKTIDSMYEYGKLIGLAFQIQDDYLDVISDEESLGKPIGSDIAKGKMTLMVVKALSEANEVDSERLVEILKNPNSSQDEVDEAIEIFNKYGSIQYAHDVAQLNVNKAKELLEILPDSEAKTSLSLIADFVLSRKS
ncbi:MAG: polyprenyl synthetase family protein [Methanobacteriaceae archaeon]|mgnify:CR=1 FL=1|nr:polyprenyl synthetase family protein [Methanobacteriaceae archaeon]